MSKSKKCKICKSLSKSVFNINFKATYICEKCANSIFLQQAKFYVENLNIKK